MIAVRALLALGAFAIGCICGWYATSGHYEGRQAKAERHAQALHDKAVADGAKAADELRAELAERSRFTHTLLEKQAHAQLTVPVAACGSARGPAVGHRLALGPAADVGGPAGAGAAAGGAAVPGRDVQGGPGAAAPGGPLRDGAPAVADGPAGDDGGPGLRLSLAAVSLWNSALLGEHVPAGACGADGAAPGACAADSGLGLEAAWRNHAINAATCAEDRARYQRLIDHLRTREARP